MAITSGSTARADDFITKSERNGTKSNDTGRVPQLESDGYLDPEFLKDVSARLTRTADFQYASASIDSGIEWDAEDFDTASLHATTANANVYNETTDDTDNAGSTTATYFAQEITTGAGQANIIKIQFNGRHTLDDSNNVEIAIRLTRTGADLYSSGTISFNGSGTSSTQLTHHLPDFILSPSTTYNVIVKVISLPGSGTFNMRENAAGTGGYKSTDSGANWTTTNNGFVMTVVTSQRRFLTAPEAGKYLIIGNINSGVTANKTVKIKVNNTTVATHLVDGSSGDAGASIQTIYTLAANDRVTLTVNCGTSAADDVLSAGSSFEMIRLR